MFKKILLLTLIAYQVNKASDLPQPICENITITPIITHQGNAIRAEYLIDYGLYYIKCSCTKILTTGNIIDITKITDNPTAIADLIAEETYTIIFNRLKLEIKSFEKNHKTRAVIIDLLKIEEDISQSPTSGTGCTVQ